MVVAIWILNNDSWNFEETHGMHVQITASVTEHCQKSHRITQVPASFHVNIVDEHLLVYMYEQYDPSVRYGLWTTKWMFIAVWLV